MNELPRTWCWALVDHIVDLVQYGTSAKTSNDGCVPVLRMGNIYKGRIDYTDLKFLPEDHPDLRNLLLEDGDVLFNRTNSAELVGKTAVYRGPPNSTSFASYIIRLRTDRYVPELLSAYINSPFGREWVASVISQQVGQANLNGTKLRALEVPLIPEPEQARIVEKLQRLSARTNIARADLHRATALAAAYRTSFLAAGLAGTLTADWRREHGANWADSDMAMLVDRRHKAAASRRGARLREMPALRLPGSAGIPSWASGCVADVADLLVGYAFKSTWFSDEGPRLLRGANVAVGRVSWADSKRLRPELAAEYGAYTLHEGDIVLAMDRPLISAGLKIAMISALDAGCFLVQRVACPRPTPLIDRRYLWWVLNSDALISEIEKHASGSDLPHISSNDILSTPISLPPLGEQIEIARRLDLAFAEIDRMTSEIAAAGRLLDRLDQAVVIKAFRGELVPQDPADEPASVLLDRIRAERAATPVKSRRGRQAAVSSGEMA